MVLNATDSIQTYPPFDSLNEAELSRVEQTLERVVLPKGTQVLKRDGPPNQYLYLIRRGAVRLEQEGQVVQVLEEADFFGYVSLLKHSSPIADVITEEEVEAYRLPAATFRQLIEQPAIAEFFQRRTARLQRLVSGKTTALLGDLTTPVADLVFRPPVYVRPEDSIAQAAQIMLDEQISSVLVNGELPGIITDYDLRRALASGLAPEAAISWIMNPHLKTLAAETPVYGALLFMLEENIHHLPLTRAGEIVGVVSDADLLRHQAKNPLYLLKRVKQWIELDELGLYNLEITGTVETLFKGGLDVVQIGRVIASLNDSLTQELLRQAEKELGPPPTPYAWIVFGSEGRQEQALLTDQDNALIYAEDNPAAQTYFAALAQQVVNNRLKAGFPPCPGGYEATHWHRPLAEFVRLFETWLQTPDPKAMLETGIFFDFRPVYGQLSLEPLEQVLQSAHKQQIFLAHVARSTLEFKTPLGFFGHIQTDDGLVDLKKGGISSIVALARLYALEIGASARSTLHRLDAAAQTGNLSRESAETLAATFRFLLALRLKEQLHAYRAGDPLTNQVRLEGLSPLERRQLKAAFQTIRQIQKFAADRFHTAQLG